MKKIFNIFICLLLCFNFIIFVHAEDGVDIDEENGEYYEHDVGSDGEDGEGYEESEGEYEETGEYEEPGEYEDDPSNEELLNDDANVENSQTSDIPIILIASVAIISLIVVLSKKNNFVNNRY